MSLEIKYDFLNLSPTHTGNKFSVKKESAWCDRSEQISVPPKIQTHNSAHFKVGLDSYVDLIQLDSPSGEYSEEKGFVGDFEERSSAVTVQLKWQ